MDEDNEKTVISIANQNVDHLFEKLSVEFIFNGTHIKCQNNETWPQQWIILPDNNLFLFELICSTSNFPAVSFIQWIKRNSAGYDK